VELQIAGPDLTQLVGVGRQLFGELSQAVPGARVRPVPVLDDGAAEFHITPKQEQATKLGFSSRDIGLIADAYVDGAIIGEFGEEGKRKVDVVLRGASLHASVDDDLSLAAAPVATPSGALVPFGTLAEIDTRLGPTVVQRIERKRAITLQVTPPDELPFETAIEQVETRLSALQSSGEIPSQVDLRLGGSAGKLISAQQQFARILLIALVISFLLLAGLFEDFIAPLAVMVTVPLAAAGGVLALVIADGLGVSIPLDLMSALGFVILIGVVVNNAILIVDGAMARLREGTALDEAVGEAVRARVRPIFMSTLTSLAGLTPMVVSSGAGSELYRGVGTIVLGGLALSTVLALFVVPSLFAVLWRLRRSVVSSRALPSSEGSGHGREGA